MEPRGQPLGLPGVYWQNEAGHEQRSETGEMMFDALMVNKDEESGKTHAEVTQIDLDRLPEGDVTVAVE